MRKRRIVVFEHERLWVGRENRRGDALTEGELEALQRFADVMKVPYYSLIYKGIQFGQYVGVLQVGGLILEVLPKADKLGGEEKWRGVLIGMLYAAGYFRVKAPSLSSLQLKTHFVLSLYFELFVQEVEYLVRRGLVKQYRKEEGNCVALKGKLLVGRHLRENIVHQERVYVRYPVYDHTHMLHEILYTCLLLVKRVNQDMGLHGRICRLLWAFPDMKRLEVTEAIFTRLVLNRKTAVYEKALEVARLLLLGYHPNVTKGREEVLALLFDMNMLWEKFVYMSLRKHAPKGIEVAYQDEFCFWQSAAGGQSNMSPDIVLYKEEEVLGVVDVKWKLIGRTPSAADLRQIFVYMTYYETGKGALLCPGEGEIHKGNYYRKGEADEERSCDILTIDCTSDIWALETAIAQSVFTHWLS